MGLKTFTKSILCCALFVIGALSAKAADRLVIVGDATWGGWNLGQSTVMQKSDENADVFKATVHLDANKEFKFLTELGWGNLEYRAGAGPVTLQSGVAAPLVSSEDEPKDGKFFVSESANYDIVCNLATKKVVVTKAAYQTTALKHTALWMIGSATKGGWSIGEGTIMKADATNPVKFSARTELKAGELKFGTNVYAGFSTWYDFAVEILKDTDVKIKPVDSSQFPAKAKRPLNSTMSLTKAKATGFVIPTWQDALKEFYKQEVR